MPALEQYILNATTVLVLMYYLTAAGVLVMSEDNSGLSKAYNCLVVYAKTGKAFTVAAPTAAFFLLLSSAAYFLSMNELAYFLFVISLVSIAFTLTCRAMPVQSVPS